MLIKWGVEKRNIIFSISSGSCDECKEKDENHKSYCSYLNIITSIQEKLKKNSYVTFFDTRYGTDSIVLTAHFSDYNNFKECVEYYEKQLEEEIKYECPEVKFEKI